MCIRDRSCDSWLYEEEGDCSVYYRLKFCYDKNLKWADAFTNEEMCIRDRLKPNKNSTFSATSDYQTFRKH